jgi:hypothetical protein
MTNSDIHELFEIAKGLGLTSMVWAKKKDNTWKVFAAAWPLMVEGETEMEALVKLIDEVRKKKAA